VAQSFPRPPRGTTDTARKPTVCPQPGLRNLGRRHRASPWLLIGGIAENRFSPSRFLKSARGTWDGAADPCASVAVCFETPNAGTELKTRPTSGDIVRITGDESHGHCHCGSEIRFEAEIDPNQVRIAIDRLPKPSRHSLHYVAKLPAPSFLRSGAQKIYIKTAESGNKAGARRSVRVRHKALCGPPGANQPSYG